MLERKPHHQRRGARSKDQTKTRRREPAGFVCFSFSAAKLIPQLRSRLAADEFDHQITSAGDLVDDIVRLSSGITPFIVFHDILEQHKQLCLPAFRRPRLDCPHLFDKVVGGFALAFLQITQSHALFVFRHGIDDGLSLFEGRPSPGRFKFVVQAFVFFTPDIIQSVSLRL